MSIFTKLRTMNYRSLLLIQFFGTVAILSFVPGNITKAIAFIVWWAITFRGISRAEIVMYLIAAAFFTQMDYATLKQGIFQFSSPDFLLMPYYEPLLWGYLLLHIHHMWRSEPPKTSWLVGLGILAVFIAPYLIIVNQLALFIVSSAIVLLFLSLFHERDDLLYVGYLVLLGTIWEYAGVWSGQWSYPNPPAGGVPPWFIPTFAGVALSFRRMVVPLIEPKNESSTVRPDSKIQLAPNGRIANS